MSEKVFFKNEKEEKLVGLLDHVNFDKLVIALHGFESNKEIDFKRKIISSKLTNLGYSFFVFDFAGCGESTGNFKKTSIKSRSQDFKAALNFLKSKGYKDYAVIGFSMGSAVAIHSWSKKIKAMALVVPLTQPKSVFESLNHPDNFIELIEKKVFEFTKTKDFYNELGKLDLDKKIEKITSPTLLVQANQDTLVFKRDTKKTYRMLNCKKKYFEVRGTHFLLFPLSFDKVLDEVVTWFEKYF
jgi:alpha-beta hydrolase superfamily lysophospholipase